MDTELSDGETDEDHPAPQTRDEMPAAHLALARHSRTSLGPEAEDDPRAGRSSPTDA